MSIVDNPTPLNVVSWAGVSSPDFTTSVLETLADCVAEVESKLKRGTLSASTIPTLTQVQNWLKRAKMELAEVKGFSFNKKIASGLLSAGMYRFDMPPDYNGGAISLQDINNHRYITIWPENWYNKKYPYPSAETPGEIMVACVKNMELWVVPQPSENTGVFLEYDRSGAETTSDSFAWLPEIERFRCCDFALGEAFASLHMWEQSQLFMGRWNQDMAKAMKVDGKRKWQGKRYQAINVFQDFAAINYQP